MRRREAHYLKVGAAVALCLCVFLFSTHSRGLRTTSKHADKAEAAVHAPPEFIPLAAWREPVIGRTPVLPGAAQRAEDASHWRDAHLFAAVVHVRDSETGERVSVDRSVWGNGPAYRFLDEEVAKVAEHVKLDVALSRIGLDQEAIHRRDDNLLVYSVREGHFERLGPLLYEIEIPGYQPIYTDQVYVERISSEGVASITLFTTPLSSDWGSLRIHWTDRGPLSGIDLNSDRAVGEFYLLTRNAGRVRQFGYIMVHLPLDDEIVQRLPPGDYQGQFRSSDWPFEYPLPGFDLLSVKITRDAEAVVELSAASTGVLVIDPPPDIEGAAWFIARKNSPVRASEWTSQDGPPLTFAFLQPGEYSVTMTDCKPRGAPWTAWQGPPVDVVVGVNELAVWPYPITKR